MREMNIILVVLFAFYLNSACADMICGQTASTKQQIITFPKNVPFGGVCTYTIQPTNNNICQLRIDFLNFTLAQPTKVGTSLLCIDDDFFAGRVNLCGENVGQHIYVEFNATVNPRPIVPISFKLAERPSGSTLPQPNWTLGVTQLECPPGSPRQQNRPDTADHPLHPDFSEGISEVDSRAQDGYYIPPAGCLQYFPQPSGTIQSFNYNKGAGPYLSNMKYSICFNRFWNSSTLTLESETFALNVAEDAAQGIDADCYSDVAKAGVSEDYLNLPYATVKLGGDNVRATKFCNNIFDTADPKSAVLRIPGPFMIQFNSDNIYDETLEKGFQFKYSVK